MDIQTINQAIDKNLTIHWKEGLMANSNGIIGLTLIGIVMVLFTLQAIKTKKASMLTLMLVTQLLYVGGIVAIIKTVEKEETNKINTYKTGHKYAEEGTYRELGEPYISPKIEGMLTEYLQTLPKERTRQYEGIQTDRKGNIYVKIEGNYVRAYHQPNVVIDITKKPVVTYSKVPEDITGIFKAGDIVNVWVVND